MVIMVDVGEKEKGYFNNGKGGKGKGGKGETELFKGGKGYIMPECKQIH